MVTVKQPATYDEQIKILRRHGCIIKDEKVCKAILSQVNYYRLSAYFLPFKQSDGTYYQNTSFEQVYHIYEFDRQLRNILYGSLESVEITLRARLSYFHSLKYGPLGYMNPNNFNSHHQAERFNENIQREVRSNRKVLFVKHHLEKYEGNFPIWVITELFTFGMLSYFYSDLKTADQKVIAREYGVNYKDLRSWLRCCTDLRNICAHYGRLYYRIFSAIPAGINLPVNAKRRLWGYLLMIKALYPEKVTWNNEVVARLKELFQRYSADINLYHISFPDNWLTVLKNK